MHSCPDQNDRLPIFILGDIHGEFDIVKRTLTKLKLSDCIIIQVGDFGVGFADTPRHEKCALNYFNRFLKKHNIKMYVIRGNHDDPRFFDGRWEYEFSNISLLPDYSRKVLNGQHWLFIGGAISIDRGTRVLGFDMFEGECLNLEPSRLLDTCDVLVMHTVPTWIGPTTKKFGSTMRDSNLKSELDAERNKVDEIFKLVQPKVSYHGHMHCYAYAKVNGCESRILDCHNLYLHNEN